MTGNATHRELSTPGAHLDFVATGSALTCTLVGLFVACALAARVWPTSRLAHGWVLLFATSPENIGLTVLQGVLGSIVAAWAAALLFVPMYNWVARR